MEITKDIKYVGVNDHQLELFEGQYPVPNGMSYNSYVILDEKIAVMDTVDVHFKEKWLCNVGTAMGGRTPDYLIIQHMEPDHSAAIADFMRDFLGRLTERNYQNRRIAILENGSWAPTAAKVIRQLLEKSNNITWVEPAIQIKSAMTEENREQLKVLAEELC